MTEHGVQPQRGMTLLIALVLLMAMTALAMASLQGALLQERMDRNIMDRQVAFQAAEAALAEGVWLLHQQRFESSRYTRSCQNGRCHLPDIAPIDWTPTRWRQNGMAYGASGASFSGTLREAPRLAINYLEARCNETTGHCQATFILTALAWGAQRATRVTLQRRVMMAVDDTDMDNGDDAADKAGTHNADSWKTNSWKTAAFPVESAGRTNDHHVVASNRPGRWAWREVLR